MPRASALALVFCTGLAAAALAQAPAPPARLRGTVESFAGHTLTIKEKDGDTTKVMLAPDFKVRAVVPRTLADIKPGDRVGITSVPAAEGGRKAVEIHIFPADMPNVRMIQLPWDLGPGSLMTNAPVAEVSTTGPGPTIAVTLNGKQSHFTVPPGTPIVTYAPAGPSLLRPGAAVFVVARKLPDGSYAAPAVTAEQNGVKPPM